MTDTNPFVAALKQARKALEDALQERSAIERHIVNLKQTIEGLSALCEPEEAEEVVQVGGGLHPQSRMSLTDAIRKIFSESNEPILTPTEVRDALLSMGIDLGKYKQPLVPIHNTLKRLESQEEIVAFRDDNGSVRGYRWVSAVARAVAEVERPRLAFNYNMEPPPGYSEHPMRKAFGRPRSSRAFYGEVDPDKLPDGVRGVVGQPKKK